MRRLLILMLFAAACAPPPEGFVDDPFAEDDGKEDRGGATVFREVDAAHSTATFRRYIGSALALLEAPAAPPIARLTAQSIREGRVAVDEVADLTCWDFDRLRRELDADLTPADFLALRRRGSTVAAAISAEINGYMWSNRVYVARGMTSKRLAATLVHEVNHVINRSEIGYWDDLPTSAFRHEYRAFHAERLFDPTPYRGVELVDYVVELYDLDGAKLDGEARAQPLTPRLLPDAEAWEARRTADDPADVEADCPTYR